MNDEKDIQKEADASSADVTFEEVGEDGTDTDPHTQIKKLREKLKSCVEEKQTYLDGWQRAKADFVNARKRDEEDKREFIRFAKEGMLVDILPVLQSFEMAFGNREAWEKVDKNWRIGVEYIYSQLKQTLEAQGLKEISPLGLPFDPARDEAVEYVPVAKEADHHKVVEVVQKGYNLDTKALRAPKVKVGEYKG